EEKRALSPPQLLLESAPRDLDREPSTQLDPRRFHRLQLWCNVPATRSTDNGRADPRRQRMAKIVNCECGYVARGNDDEEVLADLDAHIRRHHPEMVGKYERQQLLDLIEEA